MRRYRYRAVGPDSAVVEGIADATDIESLSRQMTARGHVLLKASLSRASARDRMTPIQLQLWLQQLHVLVSAGLPLHESLLHCASGSTASRAVSARLAAALSNGVPLSQAMAEQPRSFNALMCSIVHAGEVSGTLDRALQRVHDLLERRTALKAQLRKSLSYPVFMLSALGVLAPVLVSVLVPQLTGLLALTETEMRWYTRALIATADALSAHGLIWILIAVCWATLCLGLVRVNPAARAWVSHTALRIPIVGSAYRYSVLALACRQLAELHRSGLVLHDALRLVAQGVANTHLRACFDSAAAGVGRGQQLHQLLAEMPALPTLMVHLVKTGELSGRLENTLEQAAKVFEYESVRRLERFSAVIGPVVLLCAAMLLVWLAAGLLFPLYSSIFELGGSL